MNKKHNNLKNMKDIPVKIEVLELLLEKVSKNFEIEIVKTIEEYVKELELENNETALDFFEEFLSEYYFRFGVEYDNYKKELLEELVRKRLEKLTSENKEILKLYPFNLGIQYFSKLPADMAWKFLYMLNDMCEKIPIDDTIRREIRESIANLWEAGSVSIEDKYINNIFRKYYMIVKDIHKLEKQDAASIITSFEHVFTRELRKTYLAPPPPKESEVSSNIPNPDEIVTIKPGGITLDEEELKYLSDGYNIITIGHNTDMNYTTIIDTAPFKIIPVYGEFTTVGVTNNLISRFYQLDYHINKYVELKSSKSIALNYSNSYIIIYHFKDRCDWEKFLHHLLNHLNNRFMLPLIKIDVSFFTKGEDLIRYVYSLLILKTSFKIVLDEIRLLIPDWSYRSGVCESRIGLTKISDFNLNETQLAKLLEPGAGAGTVDTLEKMAAYIFLKTRIMMKFKDWSDPLSEFTIGKDAVNGTMTDSAVVVVTSSDGFEAKRSEYSKYTYKDLRINEWRKDLIVVKDSSKNIESVYKISKFEKRTCTADGIVNIEGELTGYKVNSVGVLLLSTITNLSIDFSKDKTVEIITFNSNSDKSAYLDRIDRLRMYGNKFSRDLFDEDKSQLVICKSSAGDIYSIFPKSVGELILTESDDRIMVTSEKSIVNIDTELAYIDSPDTMIFNKEDTLFEIKNYDDDSDLLRAFNSIV